MPEPRFGTIDTRTLALTLGILIGTVAGFVLLLSRLPLGDALEGRATVLAGGVDAGDFEFYTALAASDAAAGDGALASPREAVTPVPVVVPATRSVPGSAQRIDWTADRRDGEGMGSGPLGRESYYLQAGSFGTLDEAERARASLLVLGVDAFVVTRVDGEGRSGHRVRVGPFLDAVSFAEARERLRRGSIPYDIVRVSG